MPFGFLLHGVRLDLKYTATPVRSLYKMQSALYFVVLAVVAGQCAIQDYDLDCGNMCNPFHIIVPNFPVILDTWSCRFCDISYALKSMNDGHFQIFWMTPAMFQMWTDYDQDPPSYLKAASVTTPSTCLQQQNIYVDAGSDSVMGILVCKAVTQCNYKWGASVSALTSLPPPPPATPVSQPSSDSARIHVF